MFATQRSVVGMCDHDLNQEPMGACLVLTVTAAISSLAVVLFVMVKFSISDDMQALNLGLSSNSRQLQLHSSQIHFHIASYLCRRELNHKKCTCTDKLQVQPFLPL